MFVLYETPAGYAIFKVSGTEIIVELRKHAASYRVKFNLQLFYFNLFLLVCILKIAPRWEETEGSW